jgi:hypothetical protein
MDGTHPCPQCGDPGGRADNVAHERERSFFPMKQRGADGAQHLAMIRLRAERERGDAICHNG